MPSISRSTQFGTIFDSKIWKAEQLGHGEITLKAASVAPANKRCTLGKAMACFRARLWN